ncbi:arginase [Streptoalloteichus tenebrarius]|uniref:Arginase n=1 Tax=Streptoalloteichus tenebrarius (strain ATCC 17920 / DSM 40477 / JCM 4838 / CBS 697.72 / NBRC 16177 / NCIMB 11028 / NRRL B-12390 / A12253. 1 / ISP 5477) TaxID=1933 RepID=A0ABT1HZG3_STRSD|nr:arginase family protein [Streptoalloteichus tenebrarius]MCP2260922.1 arginase [Streptoalloteichus tenebrarius]BFF03316.1 arginase family protein [Streptoalloteichus tenebrarius]
MPVELLAVPQHQGAVVVDGGRLPTGCAALAELAGAALGRPPRVVAVASGTTPLTGGVASFSGLVANRWAQLAVLRRVREPVLLVGGDCGVETAALAVARARWGDGLGVVWWDAHADLNTPGSSPSAAFHGMALRAALGEGDPALVADPPVVAGQVVLAGVRALDPDERAVIAEGLVTHLGPDLARDPGRVAAALVGSGASHAYLHVDLDVLDPDEFGGACCPEPGGLTVDEVVAGIEAVAAALPVVGVGVTECVTTDPVELRRIMPILEAAHAALARWSD